YPITNASDCRFLAGGRPGSFPRAQLVVASVPAPRSIGQLHRGRPAIPLPGHRAFARAGAGFPPIAAGPPQATRRPRLAAACRCAIVDGCGPSLVPERLDPLATGPGRARHPFAALRVAAQARCEPAHALAPAPLFPSSIVSQFDGAANVFPRGGPPLLPVLSRCAIA